MQMLSGECDKNSQLKDNDQATDINKVFVERVACEERQLHERKYSGGD